MEIEYQRFAPYVLFIIIAGLAYAFVTGKLSALWNTYEIPTAILLIFVVILVVWIYSNIKPGFPGKLQETLIFYGFMGNMFRRFEALFVEITDLLNEKNIEALKNIALSDLEGQLQIERDQKKIESIKRQIEEIRALNPTDLRKHMHIYGTRKDFQRYVWIWLDEKPIDDAAFSSFITTFNFPYGWVRRRAVFGIQANLAHSVKMLGYGKVKVRVFLPLIRPNFVVETEQKLDQSLIENIGLLGTAIRTAVAAAEKIKEYKKRIESLQKANNELHKDIAKLTGQVDIARKAANAHAFDEPTEEEKRFGGLLPKPPNYLGMLVAGAFGALIFGKLLPNYIKTMDPVTSAMIGVFAFGLIFMWLVSKHG